jgi:UDPglucose 6-dehydrogenase
VGVVTGTCLADIGYEVSFIEPDKRKVECINADRSPIFEPGLDEMIHKNKKRISATMDPKKAMKNTQITFLCVGTPSNHDGSIDLSYIEAASSDVGNELKNRDDFPLIVIKSTVLPGTTEDVVRPLIEAESGKIAFQDFGLASNPEFLRERRNKRLFQAGQDRYWG